MISANDPAVTLPEPAVAGGGSLRTLLLVEDDESVRQALGYVLESQGYKVLAVSNGLEALRIALAEEAVAIDLVVTDVVMPDMGGREMIDWMKAALPELKVLMVSGHPGEIFTYQSGQYTDVFFLAKPFTPTALLGAVQGMLEN